MEKVPKWERKDTSPIFGASSVIDVSMGLGEILFSGDAVTIPVDGEKANGAELLRGNKSIARDLLEGDSKRPVIKDQE